MNTHIKAFLRHLSQLRNYSEHTLVSYENDLEQLLGYLSAQYEITEWGTVTHHMIRSWMADLMDRGYEARSIARKLSSGKSFFKYLLKHRHVGVNPASKLTTPKQKKRLPKSIRAEDLEKLKQRHERGESFFSEIRDLLIVDLLYVTGMRRSELIGLSLSSLDSEATQLTVLGKGNKERIIPLHPEMQQQIISYIRHREERSVTHDRLLITDRNKPLYPKFVYNVVKRTLMRVSTAQHVSPHALRHSFATHLLDEGADLNAVKELLGHANLSATEVYTHNTVEKLKRSYVSAHPKS